MALSLSSLLLLWCAELSLLASSLWLLSSTVVVVGLYLVAITSKWQTEIAYECLWACVCVGGERRVIMQGVDCFGVHATQDSGSRDRERERDSFSSVFLFI